MESLDGRLIESREISRYLIGLTVFLGLLGTFWGLLETINSVGVTVNSLNFSEDTQKLFKVLKQGLEEPLGGMGTAFSSSLFGLGGSLILGFLDLQSGQAQNRFYNEVEEKLSQHTKFTLMNMDENDKRNLGPAYIESLIEVTTENLKKSTSVIDKQNDYQESISKSLYDINNFLSENIALNKEIKDEIKVLSKTIANISKKIVRTSRKNFYELNIWPGFVDVLGTLLIVTIFTVLISTVTQIYFNDQLEIKRGEISSLDNQITDLADKLNMLNIEKKIDKKFARLTIQYRDLDQEKSKITEKLSKSQYNLKIKDKELNQVIDERSNLLGKIQNQNENLNNLSEIKKKMI